jgi:hypothetical protein
VSVVVDTNVAVVAEGLNVDADHVCVDACVDRLVELMEAGSLLLDEADAIVEEYTKTIGHAGQPGIGRAFVRWAWDYRFDDTRIRRIAINDRTDEGWRKYDEFPDRANLKAFDKSDQKFVAVALASGENPPILHATDRGWWTHGVALASAGVSVESLCPQHAPCD